MPTMEQLKTAANEAFVHARYNDANELYSQALALVEHVVVPAPQKVLARAKKASDAAAAVDAVAPPTGNGVQPPQEEPMADDGPAARNGYVDAEEGTSCSSGCCSSGSEETAVGVNGGGEGTEVAREAEEAPNGIAAGDEANEMVKEELKQEVTEWMRMKSVLLSNRALVRIRLEQYGFAICDANDALSLDPEYLKPMYRRGTAHLALGDVKRAEKDFREILSRKPGDQETRNKLQQCTKVLREERFSRALQLDGYESDGSVSSSVSVRSAAESIDLDAIAVEDTYGGPSLTEDAAVDADFVAALIDVFRKEGKLHYKYAVSIVLQAKELFEAMPNIVEVPVPSGSKITVCGDVHGQFYDLADSIFAKNGMPSPENPYVFNGDFVDRGSFSVEVILTLLAIKVACPEAIHLTRGNHESINMNKIYGFEGEVKAKYSRDVFFRLFTELFQSLPLGYILDGTVDGASDGRKAFIVHGGLFSRDGVTIAELQALDRRREPDDGLMAELLWSDPQPTPGWGPSKRGIGISFGPDVTHRFLDANGLDIIVRSHEMKDEGYEVGADGRLVTIFSAPNYCDQMGNKGAYISFDSRMQPAFTQFSAVPHPPVKAMAYASGWMGLM